MNADLRFRLRPLYAITNQEERFLNYLIRELCEEALFGLAVDADTEVKVDLEYIQGDEDDSAYMLGDGETFRVILDKRMPFGMITDFLIHELAHVHSWELAHPREDHCVEFGKSYALLYRKYLELYDLYWGGV